MNVFEVDVVPNTDDQSQCNEISTISYNKKGAQVFVKSNTPIRFSYKRGLLTGASNSRESGAFRMAIEGDWLHDLTDAPIDAS